jgi:hypothetical protein
MSGTDSPSIYALSKMPTSVKNQIRKTLEDIFPIWQSIEALDWKRVVRPSGVGTFSINIESYCGIQSWVAFRKLINGKESCTKLAEIIHSDEPRLLGYVSHSGSSMLIQDVFGLITCWSRAIKTYLESGLSINDSIERVINEVDSILETNNATQEIVVLLSGLQLPDDVDQITFTQNVIIRKLSNEEISEYGSNDISSDNHYDIISRFVTTAIVITKQTKISLNVHYSEPKFDLSDMQKIQDLIDTVLFAIHILKSGRTGVVASFTKYYPIVLPNMNGLSSSPLVVMPFASMVLDRSEISELIGIYNKLIENERDEINISVGRL